MSANCPNRLRTKRVSPGGGSLLCPGKLEARFLVSLSFPAKRMSRGTVTQRFEDTIGKYWQLHGKRVSGHELAAAQANGQWDMCCDTCNFALSRLKAAAKKQTKRRRIA